MSMTLWVHVLEGRQLTNHEDDRSLMNKFSSELDAVCAGNGVTLLSSFFDYTDLSSSLSEHESRDDADSEEINPETGWSYGIDDMTWFSANEGLATLSFLRAHLSTGSAHSIPEEVVANLQSELDSCIAKLAEPASRDAKFHLAVIM
jgi:hypothetical protein